MTPYKTDNIYIQQMQFVEENERIGKSVDVKTPN